MNVVSVGMAIAEEKYVSIVLESLRTIPRQNVSISIDLRMG